MNNVISNPKTLSRLWAALSCDFETLIAKFMGSKGWRYVHFTAICRQLRITLVLHITQGRGKTKDEHYYRITDMILQMCKGLWLRPGKSSQHNKTDADFAMNLKRTLSGFYLLYTMYEKQPYSDRVKIALGISDVIAFNRFCKTIQVLPCYNEIAYMLLVLKHKNAFHYCIFSEDYRFEASTRNFMNISRSEVVELTRRMRDTQDVLAYSSVNHATEDAFNSLTFKKQILAREVLQTVYESNRRKHMNRESAFATFVHAVTSRSFYKATRRLDQLLDAPVMTLQGLTATEAIDKRMMVETRRRMERVKKKAVNGYERDDNNEPQRTVRPYVREGGIFGRKKETEEGEDKTKRRERGACNGNLWIFINNESFDKPMPPSRPACSTGSGKSKPHDQSDDMDESEEDEEDYNE